MDRILSTVRLQLHAGFTLDDAAAQADYYAALGITHYYLSPVFAARPGSTHGYDCCDPTTVNPELGGLASLDRLVQRLHGLGMGMVLDIVPNHMAASMHNPWWQDLLRHGADSPHAGWFDVAWPGPLVLPFLSAPYGEALAKGLLRIVRDPASGEACIEHHGQRYPLAPGSHAFGDTPNAGGDAQLEALNAGTDQAHGDLHALLERQHYRLCWWRNAGDTANYRRFFEISDLVGLRVERDDVFDAAHALVLSLWERGWIDGVRIDHVDGLADPAGYCRRLRARMEALASARPGARSGDRPWIVVEKILAADEPLRRDWQVDGSTGYDFMGQASALQHDPRGADPLRALWSELTGDASDFNEHVVRARRMLLAHHFTGEHEALARQLHAIAQSDTATRDATLPALRRALAELLCAFPVYRIYGPRPDDAQDHAVMERALHAALARCHPADAWLVKLVSAWLGKCPSDALAEAARKFRQLTPPMAAKSVEDTAFYRYGPLLSRNEVGADPDSFALGPQALHAQLAARQAQFPRGLLATATHDHKRGEDLRARLAVLSELHGPWADAVRGWFRRHDGLRKPVLPQDRVAPQPADEAMLYQMLVGAWPPELRAGDPGGLAAFCKRIAQWQQKALREAKQHSGWLVPDERYEEACQSFLQSLLQADTGFTDEAEQWARRLALPAAVNALGQLLLRLAAPGIPDLYQGTEFWDFSLVDPDNRSAVDHSARRRTLHGLAGGAMIDAGWQEAASQPKQAVIRQALQLRQAVPGVFLQGSYLPLQPRGAKSHHVFAFARAEGAECVVAIALRLPAGLGGEDWAAMSAALGDTAIELPDAAGTHWLNVLDGRRTEAPAGAAASVARLLGPLPIALLRRITQ